MSMMVFGSHLVLTIQNADQKVLFSNGKFKMAAKKSGLQMILKEMEYQCATVLPTLP